MARLNGLLRHGNQTAVGQLRSKSTGRGLARFVQSDVGRSSVPARQAPLGLVVPDHYQLTHVQARDLILWHAETAFFALGFVTVADDFRVARALAAHSPTQPFLAAKVGLLWDAARQEVKPPHLAFTSVRFVHAFRLGVAAEITAI